MVAYNDGRQRQQPTTVAAAAYIDDSRRGVVARDRGHMRGRGRDKGALIADLDLKYLASLILPRSFVCVGVGILFVVLHAFC